MNLDELATTSIPASELGHPTLDNVGPHAQSLADRLKSEQLTRTLVANTFWQAYLSSQAFSRISKQYGVNLDRAEPIVVRHGELFTLLVEQREWTEYTPPLAIRAEVQPAELEVGWHRAMSDRIQRWENRGRSGRDPREVEKILQLGPALAREAGNTTPFYLLFVPASETKLTSVPQPPTCLAISTPDATAGAAVRDNYRRIGVTGPAHALPSSGTVKVQQGTNIYTGTIASHEDRYTDSCFIVLDADVNGQHPLSLRSSHGPLKVAPRLNSIGTFEGFHTTPACNAVIKAANYELPYLDPYLQQTVRTDPVTADGDSGAALFDDQGFIVGFAYSRTLDVKLPKHAHYSAWIWADAVFERHGLTPY